MDFHGATFLLHFIFQVENVIFLASSRGQGKFPAFDSGDHIFYHRKMKISATRIYIPGLPLWLSISQLIDHSLAFTLAVIHLKLECNSIGIIVDEVDESGKST